MATGVDAAGNDLAIAVLLDELAVAYIIFIIAFETFAFLVFLDGGTIALACLEGALELRTVGIAGHTLTVDLAKRHNAVAIVKGVRSIKDFEYERDQADFNKLLSDGLDTILFYSRPELSALSSSMIRTLKMFGKDVSQFLPKSEK